MPDASSFAHSLLNVYAVPPWLLNGAFSCKVNQRMEQQTEMLRKLLEPRQVSFSDLDVQICKMTTTRNPSTSTHFFCICLTACCGLFTSLFYYGVLCFFLLVLQLRCFFVFQRNGAADVFQKKTSWWASLTSEAVLYDSILHHWRGSSTNGSNRQTNILTIWTS